MIKTLYWTDEGVVMIDQRRLPTQELYPVFRTYEDVAGAIKDMVIRGAPAIGIAAAMGVALGARDIKTDDPEAFAIEFESICDLLASTRPTAVNLFWAIERMKTLFTKLRNEQAAADIDSSALDRRSKADAPRGR